MIIENSNLKASSLQLNRYFVTQLNVVANPLFDVSKGIVQKESDLCVSGDVSKDTKDPSVFQIKLNIKMQSSAESNLPYSIVVEIIGVLKSGFTGADEQIQKVIFVNGSSMMYGTAREVVRAATALGPYAQVLLPSVVFVDPVKQTIQPPASQPAVPKAPAAN